MADIFSSQKRTAIMARIRGTGNARTELALLNIFRHYKITGWRRRLPLFGKPDFVFRKQRLVLFVDGCFWHNCPKHATLPGSNSEFWIEKFARNRARDQVVNQTLRKAGWKVIRVWQHELTRKNEPRVVARIKKYLAAGDKKKGR